MRKKPMTRRGMLKAITTAVASTGAAEQADITTVLGNKSRGNNGNSQGNSAVSECMIDAATLDSAGVQAGEQVRVFAPDRQTALSSVLGTVPDDIADGGVWNCEEVCEKLDVPKNTQLDIDPFAPHPEYVTREEADEHDEFVEYRTEYGRCTDIVATAPHGGRIEYNTEKQSEFVARELEATDWSCVGFNSGGGAYDRWHITSTELSPLSFSQLGEIADLGFTHAVSFHGFGEDGVAVGGGASRARKQAVCEAIETATENRYEVYIPEANGSYAGTDSDNYVNWLSASGGIQIEQPMEARRDDWQAIAQAVVSVFE